MKTISNNKEIQIIDENNKDTYLTDYAKKTYVDAKINDTTASDTTAYSSNKVKDLLNYKSGETVTLTRFFANGFITNDSKDLAIQIILPKNIGTLTPNITSLKVNIRAAYSTSGAGLVGSYVYRSGGANSYVTGGTEIKSIINTTKYINGNCLSFYCTDSNKWRLGGSNTPNNYPVSIEIDSASITFN